MLQKLDDPERPFSAFEQSKDVRLQFDYRHIPDMLRRLEVDFFIFAVDDRGHLRCHEKLQQLTRLQSSFFLLRQKATTGCLSL